MKTSAGHLGAFAALVLSAFGGSAYAQVNVTTYHNDNARTGQFTQEILLTPANVSGSQFGKVFTTAVDGWVYAQPLYLSNVSIGGGTHNVLYAATDHDTLYAIDADNGTIYWQFSLIPTNGVTVNSSGDLNCGDLVPEVGITGTPVIDVSTGTIYLVAKSKVGGNFYQYLHAIDVSTAAEKFGGPVNIQATVPGTAADGTGTALSFGPRLENQRAALLLENGHVVIGWSSHCDASPWHGWIMSYSASTLVQEAVYNTSPNGESNGVWMSGGGIAADDGGNIYFATGNGSWNGTTDLGDSIVKLGPPSGGAFPVVDYFTPYNQEYLAAADLDVASGGLVLLPTLPGGQQLLAQMAKEGKIYLVDRNNMGKYCVNQTPACSGNDPQIVQELPNATVGVWGSPAYWNGYVYWGGANDNSGAPDTLKAFSFNANNSGVLSATPTSVSTQTFGFSAPVPSISANGATAGILWGLDNSKFAGACSGGSNCQVLYAYDATDLATPLYDSSQAANSRDVPGGAVKFATPIIVNGKVFVGSRYAVSGFGLITSAVMLSPAPGPFATAQSVSLSDSTPGALIYYTTDGSTPTVHSALYSAPLTVSTTTTIQAIAAAPGLSTSALTSGTYTIGAQLPTGSVNFAMTANVDAIVNDGSPVPGAGIDGNGDAYSATLLGTSLSWSGVSFTLGPAGGLSAASSTTLNLPAANFARLYMLATAVNGGQTNQTFVITYTDGTTTPITQSLSDWFTPQNFPGESIAQTEAYRLKADGTSDNSTFYLYGYVFALNGAKTLRSLSLPNNPSVVVLAVTLQSATPAMPVTATVALDPAPGHFTTAQAVTLSDSTPGARIYYTTNGSTPTTSSALYSTPLAVSTTTTIRAIAAAPGHSISALISGTYVEGVSTPVAAAVTLAPPPGTFATAQAVSLSDSTPGALIYYTIDGSTPTVNAALYSTPLAVSETTTIKAIAVAPGYSTSALVSGSYVKSVVSTPVTAIVKLAPVPGSFTTEQLVSLSDSTPEALIRYTTDGSTPTANSALYSMPLAVSETTTIKAIAAAPGHSMSALASGSYTINAPVTVTGAPGKSGGGALDLWALTLLAATCFRRAGSGSSNFCRPTHGFC